VNPSPQAEDEVRSRNALHVLPIRIVELVDEIAIGLQDRQVVGSNTDHTGRDDRPVLYDADYRQGDEIACEILRVADDCVRPACDKRCRMHIAFSPGNASVTSKEEDRKPSEYRREAKEHTTEYAQPTQRS